jgi:hypothetical protein
VPYLDPDVASGGNRGFGDLGIAWSYVPFLSISANPWIPRTVGSGIGVIVPTGDPDDGRSLGAVIVNPFLGLVVHQGRFYLMGGKREDAVEKVAHRDVWTRDLKR